MGCISGIAQKTVANVAHIFYNIKYIWGPYEGILRDIRAKTERSLVNVEMILGRLSKRRVGGTSYGKRSDENIEKVFFFR